MRNREMKRMLAEALRLTPAQRAVLQQALRAQGEGVQAVEVVQARLGASPTCPHCQGKRVVRNGQASELQRFKCRDCVKTFNALTGTPQARLRHKAKWLSQADALREGLSVHKAAERLHVAPSTAFRWSHRFLRLPQDIKAQALLGVVEANETHFLRFAQLFGVHAWTSYLTGAALTLGSLGLLWRLLSQLRGHRYATLALLAASCITYYNGRLNYCNHNIVLMFWVAISAGLCWRACTTGRLRWWLALGAALGLGALSKYQIAVTMVSVLCFWLHQRGWRDARQRCGLLAAALVALLICVPHLLWLRTHDFGPIQYAGESP